jgi:hypothetical protein
MRLKRIRDHDDMQMEELEEEADGLLNHEGRCHECN